MTDTLNTDAVVLWFDDFNKPDQGTNSYRFLSNFYEGAPLGIAGEEFATGEHAFQAAKAKTLKAYGMVRTARTPGDAKHYGRTIPLREDWEAVKYDVMAGILRTKFTLDRYEGRKLLETGDRLLIEGTYWDDEVWGVDLHWWLNRRQMNGRNWLGTLLMARRAELRAEKLFGGPPRRPDDNVVFGWPAFGGTPR